MADETEPRLPEAAWHCNALPVCMGHSSCPHACKCGTQPRNTRRADIAVSTLQLGAAVVGMIDAMMTLIAELL